MRATDILCENYYSDFRMAVDNILAMASGRGISSISIPKLVQALNNMGYNSTPASIEAELSNSPWVSSMSANSVEINSNNTDTTDENDSEKHVKDLADAATKKMK